MNVFQKYTLQSLKKNRTRTIVTIIGIILSVAMFTGVTESIYSGQQYLINSVKATIGAFHAQYFDLSNEQLEKLSKDEEYSGVEYLQDIGYAEIGSKNEYKPYIHICGISKNFTDMVPINLREGRLPEKENEIVVSRHLYTNGRVEHKLGDVIKIEVGQRQIEKDGKTILPNAGFTPGTEKLANTKTKTYTVVGICERPDRIVESMEEAGYTAYTVEEKGGNYLHTAFFTFKDPGEIGRRLESDENGTMVQNPDEYGKMRNLNYDLLTFLGTNTGYSILGVVYGLGVILMLIIMFGSIALIYNSFSISVSERTKQFGLLRSIGATKRQMTRTVLTEALFLCGIAVPVGLASGCLGIGVTFKLLEDQFTMLTGDVISTGGAVTIKLVPNVYALALAAVISVFTALISAYIPVRRAMKISAIEAIRMSNDIKANKKKQKEIKDTGKLVGFEGMLAKKYFKRNKKKYRTTVVSLAMSLILFISASSLTFYFQKTLDMDSAGETCDIHIFTSASGLKKKEKRDALDELSKTDGVDDFVVMLNRDHTHIAEEKEITQVMKDNKAVQVSGGYAEYMLQEFFLDDETFNRLCKENGLDEKDYYNKSKPLALLFDNRNYQRYNEETKKIEYIQSPVFVQEKFPATLNVLELQERKDKGVCSGLNEKGEVIYTFLAGEDKIEEKTYKLEDCIIKRGVDVGAKIKSYPYYMSKSNSAILYPESMIEAVCGKTPELLFYEGFCKSADYNRVYEDMLKTTDSLGSDYGVTNYAEENEVMKALMTLVTVFSYGFIALISLIAAANVFNTISTNIMLRRRELAMLKSVGLSNKGFRRMMSYESILYGLKSILIGMPVSLVVSYFIYYVVSDSGYDMSFSLPFGNIVFALASTFVVVFASMIYSVKKLKKYNTADELKNENI